MIPYEGYKVLHVFGAFLALGALGGVCLETLSEGRTNIHQVRRLAAITHGFGLVLLLVAGFGLLARLGMSQAAAWPAWVWLKLVLWLVFGAAPFVIRKSRRRARLSWLLFPVLGAFAAALAIYKPG
jgi:uncharacterized membrane protein SirB2